MAIKSAREHASPFLYLIPGPNDWREGKTSENVELLKKKRDGQRRWKGENRSGEADESINC